MATTIISVRLETIQYGGWDSLEVAVDINAADGKTLYLTTPTAETILNYRANSLREKLASKSLKALLGKHYNIGKFSGIIENKTKKGTPKVTLISLTDFIKVAVWESAINQNISITQILAAGFEDSIISIAYEQLDLELKLEDRQIRLASRLKSIDKRNEETDAIKWYMANNEVTDNYKQWIYVNVSDAVNKAIFGKTAKKLCEERQCDRNHLRDTHSAKDLDKISTIEKHAEKLILKLNTEPLQAIKEAIAFYE
jgi:hypothetical protein